MTNKIYICIAVVAFVILGCSPISTVIPPATTTPTPLPTETAVPTTAVTSTPSPTETQTRLATLEPAKAQQAISDLLWNNPDCVAPCFMDIVPDHTSLEEVIEMFAYLGHDLRHTYTEDATEFYEVTHRFDSNLAFDVVISFQLGIVKNIDVALTLPQDQSLTARSEWSMYLPEALINQYGQPSKVNFSVDRGEPYPSYAMDMYFDTNDLIIEYYSYDLGLKLQICPLDDQIESVHVWLGKKPQHPPLEAIPVQQATSMTIEELSKLFTENPNLACFHLREDVFP